MDITGKSFALARTASSPPLLPYDLAHYCNGVGIYCACIKPTHFEEHAHPELQIAIPFKNASSLSTWHTATGRKATQQVTENHVSIIPANQPHASNWEREAEVLVFYLDPRFMLHAAHESVSGDSVEIAEQYAGEDLLIQQLGLALRTELQQGGLPGRLYIESLANVLAVHLLRQYSTAGTPVRDVPGYLSKLGSKPVD